MSPTYWTASQIKAAAREHGWEIRPAAHPDAAWTLHKDHYKVLIGERRDGGLCWVGFTFPVSGGMNHDHLGPRHRGKLDQVLNFLVNPKCRYRVLYSAGNTPPRQGSSHAIDPIETKTIRRPRNECRLVITLDLEVNPTDIPNSRHAVDVVREVIKDARVGSYALGMQPLIDALGVLGIKMAGQKIEVAP